MNSLWWRATSTNSKNERVWYAKLTKVSWELIKKTMMTKACMIQIDKTVE